MNPTFERDSQGVTIRGVLPVIQTPFTRDGAIDHGALDREVKWALEHGVDGLTVAMVSECLRMTDVELDAVGRTVVGAADGRPVVLSVGAESTRVAVERARRAAAAGGAAIMATPPVSQVALESELLSYYEALLEAVPLPLVVQDASGYVGTPMTIDLQAALLEQFGAERVLFKPEAEPLGPRLSSLRDETKHRARVFEGTGGVGLIDSYRRGIVGTMPGADVCWAIVALWRCLERDDDRGAYRIGGPLAALIALQRSLDAFVAVEKYLLVKQGVFSDAYQRGPVGYRLDRETRGELDRLFEQLTTAVLEDVSAPE